jgi:uncharacterized protein with gpF-like domain
MMALRRHKESALHAVADKHQAKLNVAIRYAFAIGRRSIGGYPPFPDLIAETIETALMGVLPDTLLNIVAAGGTIGAGKVVQLRTAAQRQLADKIKFTFDVTNPRVVEWARAHAAELAKGISKTSRERIKNAIASTFEGGQTFEQARDEIAAAIGDEDRANLIARHESMLAASEGQRLSWDQAVDEGLLTGRERRTWITVGDGKVCPICDDLDGATTTLDGSYPDEGGEGPPAHVNCRCTEGIVA